MIEVNLTTITWHQLFRSHWVRNKTWRPECLPGAPSIYAKGFLTSASLVGDTCTGNVCGEKMRLVLVFASLLVGCLAHLPKHCCKYTSRIQRVCSELFEASWLMRSSLPVHLSESTSPERSPHGGACSSSYTYDLKIIIITWIKCHQSHWHVCIFSLQSTQNEKLWAYAKYLYDAPGQRIRFYELGKYNNQSFTIDVLLHYREVRGPGCISMIRQQHDDNSLHHKFFFAKRLLKSTKTRLWRHRKMALCDITKS